ncbi:hypothetical protein EVAR_87258_1 [Eumeta japonica]|uniref:Uncharacterized protein n=1 Tax=Eumeta variegata TaxID=151549 RepID=A0A4C1YKE4_EUMVA|nr:hypothetical protein EVAR_87258_1 [Eumeta japonica]
MTRQLFSWTHKAKPSDCKRGHSQIAARRDELLPVQIRDLLWLWPTARRGTYASVVFKAAARAPAATGAALRINFSSRRLFWKIMKMTSREKNATEPTPRPAALDARAGRYGPLH